MSEDIIYSMKKEMLRRRYSIRTIESYIFSLKQFFKKCSKEPRYVSKKDIRDYLEELALNDKSGSTLNIHLSALKFLINDVLHRRINLGIRYSRRPKALPTVLTKQETRDLFNGIVNPKHKLMVKLLYSAGLRLSEMLNLKVRHFEFERNHGWVRKGKGNKDRPFIIADALKKEIKSYIHKEKLRFNDFMFKGFKGNRMHPSSVQAIVKKAAKKSGIKKNVHPHTLRHSFATHLIEDGYKVSDVQPLLGHNDIRTTMVYLHIAAPNLLSVKSPIDNL